MLHLVQDPVSTQPPSTDLAHRLFSALGQPAVRVRRVVFAKHAGHAVPSVPSTAVAEDLVLVPLARLSVHSGLAALEHVLPELVCDRAVEDVAVVGGAVPVQVSKKSLPGRGWLRVHRIRQAGVLGEDAVVDLGAVDGRGVGGQ